MPRSVVDNLLTMSIVTLAGGLLLTLILWIARQVREASELRLAAQVQASVSAALQPVYQRLDDIQRVAADKKERLTRIEAQFGPNGGGMREKVDRIADSVTELRSHVDQSVGTVRESLAELRGEVSGKTTP